MLSAGKVGFFVCFLFVPGLSSCLENECVRACVSAFSRQCLVLVHVHTVLSCIQFTCASSLNFDQVLFCKLSVKKPLLLLVFRYLFINKQVPSYMRTLLQMKQKETILSLSLFFVEDVPYFPDYGMS